jgi:hypothetical protein
MKNKNADFRKHILLNFFWRQAIFTAFRQTEKTEEILKSLENDENQAEEQRIRCPHCRWQPSKSSQWFCCDCDYPEYFYGGCLTGWNTFDTKGVCPGCAHQWLWTSCLRCAEWARHEDWYEKKD